jgi:hypothetical protein
MQINYVDDPQTGETKEVVSSRTPGSLFVTSFWAQSQAALRAQTHLRVLASSTVCNVGCVTQRLGTLRKTQSPPDRCPSGQSLQTESTRPVTLLSSDPSLSPTLLVERQRSYSGPLLTRCVCASRLPLARRIFLPTALSAPGSSFCEQRPIRCVPDFWTASFLKQGVQHHTVQLPFLLAPAPSSTAGPLLTYSPLIPLG